MHGQIPKRKNWFHCNLWPFPSLHPLASRNPLTLTRLTRPPTPRGHSHSDLVWAKPFVGTRALIWALCLGTGTSSRGSTSAPLTAVKREKFAKNKKNTSKERLSLLLFKVWYFTSILLIYWLFWNFTKKSSKYSKMGKFGLVAAICQSNFSVRVQSI